MSDVDLEKYKILYEHQKHQLDKHIERYRRLEEKATRYFSSMTIAIGGYLFLVRWAMDGLVPPERFMDWIVIFSVALTFLSFMCSWSFSFRATKLSDIVRMPAGRDLVDYFTDNGRGEVLLGLSRKYAEAIAQIEIRYKDKLVLVEKTYSEIACTAWSLSLSVVLMCIRKWIS